MILFVFLGRTWRSEFKRLNYHTPWANTEELTDHQHQVLHVSFSHNGKYFATCSKDGSVMVIISFIHFLPILNAACIFMELNDTV